MPKIIKNIESTILSVAQDLFIEQGYEKTDIRQIASKANIAVGTLYNYYKNKQELFFAVFKHNIANTIVSLKQVVKKYDDPEQCVYHFLWVLQKDVRGQQYQWWKHLHDEYAKRKGKDSTLKDIGQSLKETFMTIKTLMDELFDSYSRSLTGEKLEESVAKRLPTTVFTMLFSLMNRIPGETEENLKYVCYYIKCMCRAGSYEQ